MADKLKQELELRTTLEGSGDVTTFGTSYFVEAGAGAGKSTTMVRRIANLLFRAPELCAPEQLVAITFTVKATQELQTKLEKFFRDRLREAETREEKARLEELVNSVDRIQVSTIDSFCNRLLSTMPFSHPLGMNKQTEPNEKERLAKVYFNRIYRTQHRLTFAALETKYGLRRSDFEENFLNCCGLGDHKPWIPDPQDQKLADIDNALLPQAAKALLAGLNSVETYYAGLTALFPPALRALLALPDDDFDAGKPALDELVSFLCTHRHAVGKAAYNSLISTQRLAEYKAEMNAFGKKLAADWKFSKQKNRVDDALAELQDYLDSDPRYRSWVNAELGALLQDLKDRKVVLQPANGPAAPELAKYQAFFEKPSMTAMLRATVSQEAVNSLLELHTKAPGGVYDLLLPLVHRAVLQLLEPLSDKYKADKLDQHIASFNDILLMTRDMLRDNDDARAYFQQRYRCFFVDEFQDTDAIQTEILFYLTSEGKGSFVRGKWKQCRPRPGSLFLVGDPKQGIYRFRGADFDNYSAVKECFETRKLGEICKLEFNFRSTKEICDFSRAVFDRPGMLDGNACQAPYADMTAVFNEKYKENDEEKNRIAARKADPEGLICRYSCPQKTDPETVAAFVAAMIEKKMPVGDHPAQPGDFLILTYKKEDANAYAEKLRKKNVPVRLNGKAKYNETPAIANAMLVLDYLLEPDDPVRLLQVLRMCYGVSYPALRRLLERARTPGEKAVGLTTLFWQDRSGHRTRLDALAAALAAETPPDDELLALCGSLEQLHTLQSLTLWLPAQAVLARIFEDIGRVWPAQQTRDERRVDYARVRQFLAALTGERDRDFPSLARRAMELAESDVEDELPLESGDEPDADGTKRGYAQVMNLHKAKGLEGEVVILTSYPSDGAQPIYACRERDANDVPWMHMCVTRSFHGNSTVLGRELDWEKYETAERTYLDAERIRLLYVAATRARRMLVVNASQYWAPIAEMIAPLPMDDSAEQALVAAAEAEVEKASKKKNAQADPNALAAAEAALADAKAVLAAKRKAIEDEARKCTTDAERARFDVLYQLCHGEPFDWSSLDPQAGAKDARDGQANTNTSPAPPVVWTPVDAAAGAAALRTRVEKLAESDCFAVTPTALDHASRSVISRLPERDQQNDEDAAAPADSSDPDDEELPAVSMDGPRGRTWGKVVHRIMELAVSRTAFDRDSLAGFARQAAFEVFADPLPDEDERRMLCGEGLDDAALQAQTARLAAETAAFLSDEKSPLRKLMEGCRPYTELPFVLRAADQDSPLYKHMSAHLQTEKAKGKTLDVNGILDLALRRADGSWIVVDYKTNARRRGESAADFCQRLRETYLSQLLSYCRVLEALGDGPVTGACLCATAIGGALIELPLSEDGAQA